VKVKKLTATDDKQFAIEITQTAMLPENDRERKRKCEG
jgi:hypothetical protein